MNFNKLSKYFPNGTKLLSYRMESLIHYNFNSKYKSLHLDTDLMRLALNQKIPLDCIITRDYSVRTLNLKNNSAPISSPAVRNKKNDKNIEKGSDKKIYNNELKSNKSNKFNEKKFTQSPKVNSKSISTIRTTPRLTFEEFKSRLNKIPDKQDAQVVELFDSIYPPIPKEMLSELNNTIYIWKRVLLAFIYIQQPNRLIEILDNHPNIELLNLILNITNSKRKFNWTNRIFQRFTNVLTKRIHPSTETIELETAALCALGNHDTLRNLVNTYCGDHGIIPTAYILKNYLRSYINDFKLEEAIRYYYSLPEETRFNPSIASLMLTALLQNEYIEEAEEIIHIFMEDKPELVDKNLIKSIIQSVKPKERINFLEQIFSYDKYPLLQLDPPLLWMAIRDVVINGDIGEILTCLAKYTTIEEANASNTKTVPTNEFLSQLFSTLLQREEYNYSFLADLLLLYKPLLREMKMIPDVYKAHRLVLDSDQITEDQEKSLRILFKKEPPTPRVPEE